MGGSWSIAEKKGKGLAEPHLHANGVGPHENKTPRTLLLQSSGCARSVGVASWVSVILMHRLAHPTFLQTPWFKGQE